MSKTSHTNRLRITVLLGGILGVGALLAGCGGSGETEKQTAGEAETTAPAKAVKKANAHESDAEHVGLSVEGIALTDNFFDWLELRTKYREAGQRNVDIETALATKENELREKEPPKPITDALQLVAFDWKMQGEDPGPGKSTIFNISWLFYKKGAIHFEPNHETILLIHGRPDKSHARYLAVEGHPYSDFFHFQWVLKPPNDLDAWEEGEYTLLTRRASKPVPNVPHRMETWLRGRRNNEDGSRTDLYRYGKLQDLGWYVDLGD